MTRVGLLVVLLSSLAAQTRTIPQGEWYRSNALGALIERIEWFRVGEWEWTARRSVTDNSDKIDLFQNHRLVETRFRDMDAEGRVRKVRVVRNNRTRDAYELDGEGNLILEEFWSENTFRGRIEYTWDKGALKVRRFVAPNGRLVYTDEIFRTPEGRIRRIVRRYPNRVEWHSWKWGSDGLGSEIGREGEQTFFSAYGPQNQVRRQELSIANALFQISEFEWSNNRLRNQRDLIVPRSHEERKFFNERSQITLLEIREKGRLIAQERYLYDKDRVIQKERVTGGDVETRFFSYDAEGKLIREELRRNGVTEAIFSFEEEKLVREEFFMDGKLVVQTVWRDNEKIEETFFDSEGHSRTRNLRSGP